MKKLETNQFSDEDFPLPSGYVKIAIEAMAIEIVDFPTKNGGSFHSYVAVYQRVNLHFPMVFLWFSYGFPEGKLIHWCRHGSSLGFRSILFIWEPCRHAKEAPRTGSTPKERPTTGEFSSALSWARCRTFEWNLYKIPINPYKSL